MSGIKVSQTKFSDLYSSSPMVFKFWWLGCDFFWWISRSYNSNTLLSWSTHVSLICTDFPRYHRMEFLSSITELRPITLSSRRVTEKKSAYSNTLCHERQSLESSRKSWRRFVSLSGTDPLFGLSAPRGWASFSNWEFWMILFRAEAIFASNISNFGKSSPRNWSWGF